MAQNHSHSFKRKFWNKKFLFFFFLGFLSFFWVLLRSGINPKRLTYPCQRAAFPMASSWLLFILSLLGGVCISRRILKYSKITFIIIFCSLVLISSSKIDNSKITDDFDLPVWVSGNTKSKIFVLDNMPPTSGSLAAGNSSVPDEYLVDPAMDSLCLIMASQGLYLYNTPSTPNGIVEKDDIVVIKGNFQWDGRVTTNTDRIKGLIWRILNHPEGFEGEILVCDNTQDFGNIDQNTNNSEDESQSIIDVVSTFNSKGYPVHIVHWNKFRIETVQEYSADDMEDGYIYISSSKISYPKFKSPGENYISLKHGIWDDETKSYNEDRLCIINFPLIKGHSLMGSTIGLKNWVGVMTTAFAFQRYGSVDAMHYEYLWGEYALIARIMNETFPALTIIDGTWTNAYQHFSASSSSLFNTNCMIASTDPLASSWYAAKYVLCEVVYRSNSDPDYEYGRYGKALINLDLRFLTLQRQLTYNPKRISVYNRTALLNPVSTPNTRLDVTVMIYPNPTQHSFTLDCDGSKVRNLQLVDMKGMITYPQYSKNEGRITVDLSDYEPGAYLISFFYDGDKISSTIVKN